jgi:hypothetical protein
MSGFKILRKLAHLCSVVQAKFTATTSLVLSVLQGYLGCYNAYPCLYEIFLLCPFFE